MRTCWIGIERFVLLVYVVAGGKCLDNLFVFAFLKRKILIHTRMGMQHLLYFNVLLVIVSLHPYIVIQFPKLKQTLLRLLFLFNISFLTRVIVSCLDSMQLQCKKVEEDLHNVCSTIYIWNEPKSSSLEKVLYDELLPCLACMCLRWYVFQNILWVVAPSFAGTLCVDLYAFTRFFGNSLIIDRNEYYMWNRS